MKTKNILASAVVVLGGILQVQAQDANSPSYTSQSSSSTTHWWSSSSSDTDLYRGWEGSIEAFGMGTVGEHTLNNLSGDRIRRQGQIGAGAGAEFFFNKYVGVEAEAWSETTHHSFVNDAGGNLVLRLPIGNTGFAPYIFGGGGHEFVKQDQGYGGGGAGLEIRFNRHLSTFGDARILDTVHTGYYGLGRLGLKFIF